jgi:hypothetical protein
VEFGSFCSPTSFLARGFFVSQDFQNSQDFQKSRNIEHSTSVLDQNHGSHTDFVGWEGYFKQAHVGKGRDLSLHVPIAVEW